MELELIWEEAGNLLVLCYFIKCRCSSESVLEMQLSCGATRAHHFCQRQTEQSVLHFVLCVCEVGLFLLSLAKIVLCLES